MVTSQRPDGLEPPAPTPPAPQLADDRSTPEIPETPPRSSRPAGPLERFRARGRGKQDALFLGLAAAWVGLDQITKVILRESLDRGEHWELASFYRFSHIANDGAAFGLFSGTGVWLAVLPVIAIVSIAAYYLFPPVDHWSTRLGLALILGGAIGNWLDRLYLGEVTDFIDFIHFPAFNVADIGINVGIAAILIYLVISDAKRSASHR